jgi:hypothetical protein
VHDSIGLPLDKIEKCMGDPEADQDNEILKNEQEKQVLFVGMVYPTSLN